MIDGGVAESLDDSFLIKLKAKGTCIDSDRDRALNKSCGKFDRVMSFDFLEICQFDVTGLFLLSTFIVFGMIRILRFSLQSNMFGIVVAILDEASTTSVVSIRN